MYTLTHVIKSILNYHHRKRMRRLKNTQAASLLNLKEQQRLAPKRKKEPK